MRTFTVPPVSMATREPAPPVPSGQLQADSVPDAARPKPVPLARILLPALMVVAVLGMVALMVLGGGGRELNPMMLMFPLMMLASVAMMFSPQGGGDDPDETRRTYLRHLRALREKARDHGAAQRAHEFHRHPDPVQLRAFIAGRRLWERAPGDPDALEVRVGTGPVTLCTPIQVPESGAPEDLDPVCAVSLRHTVHAVGQLPDMPVVIQLQAFRFLGIGGPIARDLARAMVLQLVVAHGPETVGISALGEGWEWLKWLPHTEDPRAARFHILLVDSLTTTGLEDFFDDETLTTIIDVGALRTTALGLRAEAEGLFLVAEPDGLRVMTQAGDEPLGLADAVSEAAALSLARLLAPCRRPAGTSMARGRDGDLVGLLGYRDIDELAAGMWPGRTGGDRLNVPVGVDENGGAVNLDLKESAHGGAGPHGLCIGATGSGKSELLRTLVTALAATHSPEELNLVLVDFKGGATFLGCDALPHTSAVITNLEEEAVLVDRMFDAISGELNRRQEVLRAAGNYANVGDYNAAGHEPLPALVIVVDEFSELLGQHPDFAELFVAVGRLGRSLHVHLLLASQRLEEGRLRGLDSHLSYRFGLKTFSAAESRQVLGVTDAYHLPAQPGAGFLRAGSAELVRLQASYVSGPLTRRVAAAAATRARVQVFHGFEPAVGRQEDVIVDESTTLLDEVVRYARAHAEARGMRAHQIWLPPLPRQVALPDVLARHTSPGRLDAAVGLIDRPYVQRQDAHVVDFAAAGGHLVICGGPQSGKSTAAYTVVATLAAQYPPGLDAGELSVYVIDLGGGALAELSRLPHVAAVAGRAEPEKVRRIVDEVDTLVIDSAAGAQGRRSGETFVILDGWHHVGDAGAEFEDLLERLTSIAADGPSAGVHLVVTTGRWTAMRPAIRDHFSHRLELKLGEPMDSLIDRHAQKRVPALPGRGINAAGEQLLVARAGAQDLAHIARHWQSQGASVVPQMRVLGDSVLLADLQPATGAIPLGIGGRRLEQVDWDPALSGHLVIAGGSGAGKSTALSTVCAGLSALGREQARLVILDPRRAHLGAVPESMVAAYAASSAAVTEAVNALATTLRERLPDANITPEALAARDWWTGPELFLVIDDADVLADAALHPLVDFLPHARDVGLHVVVARKSGGISRALFGGFFAALRDQQPAVVLLSADKEEGPIFGVKPQALPPGRARWVLRGEDRGLIQIARGGEADDDTTGGESE